MPLLGLTRLGVCLFVCLLGVYFKLTIVVVGYAQMAKPIAKKINFGYRPWQVYCIGPTVANPSILLYIDRVPYFYY